MDYDEIDRTLRRLYREEDYDSYNTLQTFAVLQSNKELIGNGFYRPDEVATTYAADVKVRIKAHIEGGYTDYEDAVY
jgi:hypothetical protein